MVFGFAIVVVFLVLAAQFESFVSALIIIATVPFGVACAVYAMDFFGETLNLYSQIGLVLLVGIMAKNGILIVEFANQLREEGRSVREAIEEASIIRLRPVMMTMIATIVGGVPLIFSAGAGARHGSLSAMSSSAAWGSRRSRRSSLPPSPISRSRASPNRRRKARRSSGATSQPPKPWASPAARRRRRSDPSQPPFPCGPSPDGTRRMVIGLDIRTEGPG